MNLALSIHNQFVNYLTQRTNNHHWGLANHLIEYKRGKNTYLNTWEWLLKRKCFINNMQLPMEKEINDVLNYCLKIRNSILKVKEKTIIFKNFPFGCCRDSSLLIGLFLLENGFENFNYCSTSFDNDRRCHAWLEY